MLLKRRSLCFIIMASFLTPIAAGSESPLSKRKARELLVEKSYKWKQTDLPIADSEAKLDMAEGALSPQVSFFSREFILRTNQLLFGNTDVGPLNLIGLGSTGVQVAYDVWNKSSFIRLKAAQENLKLGRAMSSQFKNDLTFLMLLRYLNAQQAKKKIDMLEVTSQKDSELHHMAEVRLKTGFGIPLDVTRSEGLVEKDKLKKMEAELNYTSSLRELADLIGEVPAQTSLEPLTFKEISIGKLRAWQNRVFDKPAVKVAESTVVVMRQMKDQLDVENSPRVSVFGDVASVGVQPLGLIHEPTGMVGVQLTVPLYSGGLNSGKIKEAAVKLNKAELDESQLKQEVKNEIELILQKIEFAERAVKATQKQIELSKKELEYAEKKIKLGSANNLELINAQTNYATILDMNVQAVFGYEAAKLAFFHAIADVEGYLESEKN